MGALEVADGFVGNWAEDAVGNKVERRLVAACLMKKGFNALRKYGKALYAEKTGACLTFLLLDIHEEIVCGVLLVSMS